MGSNIGLTRGLLRVAFLSDKTPTIFVYTQGQGSSPFLG